MDRLSIRSYTLNIRLHSHEYHQLVLPLHGVMSIKTSSYDNVVGIGHCVIIKAGTKHEFNAAKKARFLVADIKLLPPNIQALDKPIVAISTSMLSFCKFIEVQVQNKISTTISHQIFVLFKQLLSEQELRPHIDRRIVRALEHIESNIHNTSSLNELASHACLSLSHFKVLFKAETGKSSGEYLLILRMEKARVLLLNTDYPVQIIAEKVGYKNVSAFIRRFSLYFGQSPRKFISR